MVWLGTGQFQSSIGTNGATGTNRKAHHSNGLPDLRQTLVGTTLLCISGYNGLPGRTLPTNLIHETARRSERVDNAALSTAVSYEIPGQMMEGPFLHVLEIDT